jgi:hypothetical protein
MRIIAYIFGAVIVLSVVLIAAFFFHSSRVSRRSLQELSVNEVGTVGHPIVKIDGRLLGGMVAVRSTQETRTGHSIILLVRSGITRPGLREATFHYEIRVPSDVDEISFGDPETVVWRRSN